MTTEHEPVTSIIFGTMTLGYRGYGARVHDLPTAQKMLDTFASFGHHQLDTAHGYGDGTCEEMLGDLHAADAFTIAARFDPAGEEHAHEPEKLKASFRLTLDRLKTNHAQILYLTWRDPGTPLESTLSGVQDLYEEGLFDEFGVSNFSIEDVSEFVNIATRKDWVRPAVYQGLYNAITRAVEPELFPALRQHGIRFHAYNPLAGGAFSPAFGQEIKVAEGSRFDSSTPQGKLYRDRYWNDAYLEALRGLHDACEQLGLDPISAALRWLVHHSQLSGPTGDGIIAGASSVAHLQQNLSALQEGPLPPEVLDAIDTASDRARPGWPAYSFVI
jgi:aflatoxin B1 aldehyde reductase